MREVRRIITEHRLKRTPELLVETIRTRSLSLSDLKRRIDYLRKKFQPREMQMISVILRMYLKK